MIMALTLVIPFGFALGIATRREILISRAVTPDLSEKLEQRRELWSRKDLWEKHIVHTHLLRIGPGAGKLAVELVTPNPIVRPDLLVYWIAGERKIPKSLPEDAFLLGSFEQSRPTPLTLPFEATNQVGALALYSLADQELVAVSKSFTAQ
jgi:hypothetical protein